MSSKLMGALKRRLQRALSYSKPLYAFIEGIILYVSLRRANGQIGHTVYRHLRVHVLRRGIEALKEAMRRVGYRYGILVVGEEVYSYSDGIFLNLKGTNRYLKVAGETGANEGKKMLAFLASKGISVRSMIDLGANFGEISLYFSKYCPKARILAVEPSSANLAIFESDCRVQSFPTGNIILLHEAVSNARGTVEITKGMGAENIIIRAGIHRKKEDAAKPECQTETVAADTVASLMDRFDFPELDFLKVDIEGAEPLLYQSLQTCLPRIKAVLIEVGDKADHKEYLPLTELLWEYGDCYDRESERNMSSLSEVNERILSSPVADLWFLKKNS